ncbi:hypothetical protein HMPREF3198_01170 [Winkia neuii]|nr:hypothetical protein HMPREF3198_01170 [Winkia neuii]
MPHRQFTCWWGTFSSSQPRAVLTLGEPPRPLALVDYGAGR